MHLPGTFLAALEPFRPEFRRPTWTRAVDLIAGTLLARGRRTVASALRAIGRAGEPGFQRYHEVFSRAAWSPLRLARRLLRLLVAAFAPEGGLILVIDETLERRWGRRITKRSHHRDPVASSRNMQVVATGLRWVVTALVVRVPWTRRHWALPFLSQLAPSEKVDAKRWSVEVTFEESRAHLGIETQRQWSDRSIERETPCLLGLYSVVALLGEALHKASPIVIRVAAWYPKAEATFSDVLASVRRGWRGFLGILATPGGPP